MTVMNMLPFVYAAKLDTADGMLTEVALLLKSIEAPSANEQALAHAMEKLRAATALISEECREKTHALALQVEKLHRA